MLGDAGNILHYSTSKDIFKEALNEDSTPEVALFQAQMSSGDTNIDGLALPDSIGYEGVVGDTLDENGDGDNVKDDENREMKNGMVADQSYVAAPVLSDSQDRKAMNKKVLQ